MEIQLMLQNLAMIFILMMTLPLFNAFNEEY